MSAVESFGDSLHGGAVDAAEISRIRDALLFEEPEFRRRLIRFMSLLVLASAIATFGLLANSVATVIGAMIVAPLMLPIVGLAFSVSIGDHKAIVSSILVSIAGIATAIIVGYLLAWPMASLLNVEQNAQIMTRTAPKLIDLLAAVATGLAGAFAVGRKDVSDTLPGVAIAISLVPPLANVGILLATGNPGLAVGSLLLFATNYFAILLTGAVVFGLMRFPQVALAGQPARARRRAIIIAVVVLLVIAGPLTYGSLESVLASTVTQRVNTAAAAWLKDSGYRVVTVDPSEHEVVLVVLGEGELPPLEVLQNTLKGELFDRPLRVEALPSSEHVLQTRQ